MNREIQQRLTWVKLYQELDDAGLVCRRCGISRPTLRKWSRRYSAQGLKGLENLSRRPLHSPNTKITKAYECLILELRQQRNLGARRIQSELLRQHEIRLGLASIHKVLKRNQVRAIRKYRRKKDYIRYERPIPGDRVQMDTSKISKGLYQYTAVDDCTRYRVLRLYSRRTATNTLDFLDCVIEEMPFPIQRIKTDRGTEFFAVKVQKRFMDYNIKFRPNKPGSPHLNWKVERSQKTDKTEFYPTVDLTDHNLNEELALWQHYYNWDRPHSAHSGRSPMEKYHELSKKTPYSEDVLKDYHLDSERIQNSNYKLDLEVQRLKRSL